MEGLHHTLCPTGSGFRLEALDSDSESVSSNDVPLPIRHTESTGEKVRAKCPRPMGKNATRRMGKDKVKTNTFAGKSVDNIEKRLQVLEEQNKKKIEILTWLDKIKEYKILMRDTSKMTDEHLRIHLNMVDKIKKKWGL